MPKTIKKPPPNPPNTPLRKAIGRLHEAKISNSEKPAVLPSLPRARTAPVVSRRGGAIAGAQQRRLPTLDALRGIAALAVCWFHMTNVLPDVLLKSSGAKGWMGVEMFFVISGFIIPYSMFRSGYRLRDAGRFVLKRLLRLDPPFLASLAMVLALNWASTLSPLYRGAPFHISPPQLLLHLGYLNVFFGYPWLNVVYWTLAVELQYYLLVALVFPLIASHDRRIWLPAFAVLTGLGWLVPNSRYVFVFLALFLLGMAAFKLRAGQVGRPVFIAIAMALTGAVLWTHGPIIAVLGFLTALALAFVNARVPVLSAVGAISYSLYLVHVPIGGRVVNLGGRYAHSTSTRLAVSIAGVVASMVAAWLLYLVVERPAQRWSSQVRFHRASRGETINSLGA